jgi:RsiW-degrading membrane proteinase PrsW (M82 family)
LFDWGHARTFFLSLLPGIFWITYLRSLSGGRVSAWWKWVVALAAGWASTELTLAVSDGLGVDVLRHIPQVGMLVFFVIGVGLVEEGAKALCAVVALKLPGFADRPLTALQLSCGVALGFATTENLIYAQNYGDTVIVFRFVLATLGHIMFSSLWGFALGTQNTISLKSGERKSKTPWKLFVGMLLLSALTHGLYDWFLVSGRPAFAVLLLIIMWAGFKETVLGAYLNQEYQRELPFEVVPCTKCTVLTRAEGKYCSFCGESTDTSASEPALPGQ